MSAKSDIDNYPKFRPVAYQQARTFLRRLNTERRRLTRDQYIALKNQALSGNVYGAVRELDKALHKYD